MIRVGIVGNGEVGSSLARLYEEVMVEDVAIEDPAFDLVFPDEEIELIHICTPYFEGFEQMAVEKWERHDPDLVIINSTVPVGTTRRIWDATKKAVHSPIRGAHPNLTDDLKVFVKHIGADDRESGELAESYFRELDLPTRVYQDSRTTELAKLLCTTYYGVCISYTQFCKDLCDREGLEFDEVVTAFLETLNDAVAKLDRKWALRPILYPPNGPIGGHCVVPNARMLEEQYGKHPLLEDIK
jgi:hypothetical protein